MHCLSRSISHTHTHKSADVDADAVAAAAVVMCSVLFLKETNSHRAISIFVRFILIR